MVMPSDGTQMLLLRSQVSDDSDEDKEVVSELVDKYPV